MSDPLDHTGLSMKYFVLNPRKDTPYGAASRAAIDAYAQAIGHTNARLSLDLQDWVEVIRSDLDA